MSKNRTLARPYAKAVFELANASKTFSNWSDMLALASEIASLKQVVELIKDPNFSRESIISLFIELGTDLFTQEMHNFIQLLTKAKRLNVLPEIAMIYEEMRQFAERVVSVELISAFALSDNEQQRFAKLLKEKMQCDIELQTVTDESILGGAIIRAGDVVIDGSIRGRLAKLSDAVGLY